MNKEKSSTQPTSEVMSIPTGHTVPYGYRKHCKLAEKHFKAGVLWYQEQQLKPAAKPLIKKNLRRGSV
jgi:hypothetical protein